MVSVEQRVAWKLEGRRFGMCRLVEGGTVEILMVHTNSERPLALLEVPHTGRKLWEYLDQVEEW